MLSYKTLLKFKEPKVRYCNDSEDKLNTYCRIPREFYEHVYYPQLEKNKVYTCVDVRAWGCFITLKEVKGIFLISKFELADELAKVLYE